MKHLNLKSNNKNLEQEIKKPDIHQQNSSKVGLELKAEAVKLQHSAKS